MTRRRSAGTALGSMVRWCLDRAVLAGLLVSAQGCSVFEPPAGVFVQVDAPLNVTKGQRFDISAVVQNTSSLPHTIEVAEVAPSYLKGVAIETTEPPFAQSSRVPLFAAISYTLAIPLPPGAEQTIVFHAVALHHGDFTGDFSFCIDSDARCIVQAVRSVVE